MGEVARALRSFEYRPERGRFRDWLRTIARRRLARFQVRLTRRQEHSGADGVLELIEDSDNTVDAISNESFNSRVLQLALQRIRPCFEPTTWGAFKRVWLENRSAAETAGELSLRVDAVYLAKWRVLKRLEKEVRAIAEDFSWLDVIDL